MRLLEGNVKLEGKRVRLVPLSLDHLEGLFAASKHNENWTYSPGNITHLEDMLHTIHHALESKKRGQRYPFVILDKDTNTIVGSTSYLDFSPQHRKLEIGGTWLDPKVWRTRVNTECKYLLLKYGFEELELRCARWIARKGSE